MREDDDATETAEHPSASHALPQLFVVVIEPTRARLVDLPPIGELVLGRGDEADIVLEDPKVSRRHARLLVAPGAIRLEDFGSHNGTWIDGKRVEGTSALPLGALVLIGQTTLVLARTATEPTGTTVDAGAEILRAGDVEIVLADASTIRAFTLVRRVASATLPVLVHGETGTGKELVARALHALSPRQSKPFIALNCAALPDTLVESELFGHERGAFTGAVQAKAGLLERADGGTLFLDEVAELTPQTQAKLLRALDTKRVTRIGGTREQSLDVRLVAATHRDLAAAVSAGTFRADLFHRLNGAPVTLPPLRARPREMSLLAKRFLDAAARELGRAPMRISTGGMARLSAHGWPGNVRELRHVMEHAAATIDGDVVEAADLEERLGRSIPTASDTTRPPSGRALDEEVASLERERMRAALESSGGNQRRAAELIGMPLRTFVTKLGRYGLRES